MIPDRQAGNCKQACCQWPYPRPRGRFSGTGEHRELLAWEWEDGDWGRLYVAPIAGARCYGRTRLRGGRRTDDQGAACKDVSFGRLGTSVCWLRVGFMQSPGVR